MGLWGIEGWYWFPHGDFWDKIFFHFFFLSCSFLVSSFYIPFSFSLRLSFIIHFLIVSILHRYCSLIILLHHEATFTCVWCRCMTNVLHALPFGYCTRLLEIILSERWVCEELCMRAYVCRFLCQSAFINYKCTIHLKQNKVQRDMPTIKCLQLKIQIRFPFLLFCCFNEKGKGRRERLFK